MLGLGRTFHFLMPTHESIQHSPLVRTHSMLSDDDDHDKENHCSNLTQREASEICARVKRSKLQAFREDPLLNRIRLDTTLNHQPVSVKGVGHRCTLCSSGRKSTRKHTSVWRCPTCQVSLCLKCHGHHTRTCCRKWHSIMNPKNLGL